MAKEPKKPPHGSALDKALAVLESVTGHAQPIGLPELSKQLDLPRQTVHRILVQLTQAGMIKRARERDRYIIGPRLSKLATDTLVAANHDAPVRSVLQSLVNDINETCNIGILDGLDFVYLDRIESDWPLRVTLQAGSRVPAYCTSGGKALLAHLNTRPLKRLLRARPLTAYTPSTITDVKMLERDLSSSLQSGFAVNNAEYTPGIIGIAVSICGPGDYPVAALACHAPNARISLEQIKEYVPNLSAAAAAITGLWADTADEQPGEQIGTHT